MKNKLAFTMRRTLYVNFLRFEVYKNLFDNPFNLKSKYNA
jgi:hypothetical protein